MPVVSSEMLTVEGGSSSLVCIGSASSDVIRGKTYRVLLLFYALVAQMYPVAHKIIDGMNSGIRADLAD